MADDKEPVCFSCKTSSSLMWHRTQNSELLCLDCHTSEKNRTQDKDPPLDPHHQHSEQLKSSGTSPLQPSRRVTRQSKHESKEKAAKQRPKPASQPVTTSNPSPPTAVSSVVSSPAMGALSSAPSAASTTSSSKAGCSSSGQKQGRHTLWKQQLVPVRAPLYQGSITTSDSVIHKGTTYEVGDVVSLLDRDGGVYYAVIRGFLQDEYSTKYAALTWLLPMHPNPTHFDPSTFVLGPEEDSPREMDFLEFVCHSPQSRHFQASYYHDIDLAEQWLKPALSS